MKHFKDVPRDGRMKARKKYAEGGGIGPGAQEFLHRRRHQHEQAAARTFRLADHRVGQQRHQRGQALVLLDRSEEHTSELQSH